MLTRSRSDFSHLREHKFRLGFKDTLNPLRSNYPVRIHYVVLKLQPQHIISCAATSVTQSRPYE